MDPIPARYKSARTQFIRLRQCLLVGTGTRDVRSWCLLKPARKTFLELLHEQRQVAKALAVAVEQVLGTVVHALRSQLREFVFQGDTAFALASIGEQHNLSFRFGTDSSSSQDSLHPGDPISLGLHRSDVIIIPRGTEL